jgi:serine phosphatase RsbU (regulator of sigma subunit)
MKLGTKLILAFLLLAVVPLCCITFYSYNSSIKAFRKAVEAETGTLAEDMGSRMDMVRRELGYRVERLGNFPFQQLLAVKNDTVDSRSNPLMAELMSRIGDVAPMVDSIEFSANTMSAGSSAGPGRGPSFAGVPPKPAPPGPAKPRRGSKPRSLPPQEMQPQHLIIHLAAETPPPFEGSQPAGARPRPEEPVMHFRPSAPPAAPGGKRPPISEEERQKLQDQIKQIQEFQVFLEKMGTTADRAKLAEGAKAAAEAAKKAAPQASRVQGANPLASNFASEVRAGGQTVGTVRARVSSPQVFRNVLARGRHREGEIPFIIDADNKLHTVSLAEQKKLEALQLPLFIKEPGTRADSAGLKDWVIVTRKDAGSNMTFGIARPISEPLREIRNTAARNLGFGLGMVGLALIGIIPFSNHMRRNLAELTRGAEELARGNLNARVPVRSRDEIGRLAESFNRMAHDLDENQKNLVEQERMRKELEMSRRIQEELLPKQPFHVGLVEAKGVSIPAREVGGDFFNYFPLPEGEVAVLVGDVSGKGVAAAILMANLQATLQARLPLVPDLEQLAGQLDQEISASTPQEVFLALFMSILNPRKNELRYVNAGHNPQFALLANGGIERLESTGRPLGLLPGGGYSQRKIKLSAGDALFLYTDGLVEAEDAAGNEFGQQHLEDLLLSAQKKGINEILTLVEEENRKHRGKIEAADDATMLILKIGVQAPL